MKVMLSKNIKLRDVSYLLNGCDEYAIFDAGEEQWNAIFHKSMIMNDPKIVTSKLAYVNRKGKWFGKYSKEAIFDYRLNDYYVNALDTPFVFIQKNKIEK